MIEFKRIEIDPPILITGCARGGTSLIAGCFHYLGAWAGDMVRSREADEEPNPRGFFENIVLRDIIDKGILRYLGYCPYGILSFPPRDLLERVPAINVMVKAEIVRQGYKGGPWLFKDAKMSYLWPIWARSLPEAKWVIVERDIEEIVDSCLRWSFMRLHSTDPEFWRRWAQVYKQGCKELAKVADCYHVDPARLIKRDYGQMKEVAEALGLAWDQKRIKAFVEPRYWNRDFQVGTAQPHKPYTQVVCGLSPEPGANINPLEQYRDILKLGEAS